MDSKCSCQGHLLDVRITKFCINKSVAEIVNDMVSMINISLDHTIPTVESEVAKYRRKSS